MTDPVQQHRPPVAAPAAVPPHELSRRRRLLILAICSMSLFVVGIDNTAVNLALPSIRAGLGSSLSQLQWVVDAYTLVLASLLMLSGSVADRIGRRRVFQTGLLLFGLGSLLCSLSVSTGMLIGARMLQAIGGSMLNPVAMSIITNTFHDPRERAEAIGIWGGVIGFSMALGPLIGGTLVDAVSWQAVFWINLPVVVLAALLAALFVPESKAPHPRPTDVVGQLLVMVLLASLTYGVIEGRNLGWTSATVLLLFLVAVLALAVLVRYESRREQPLIDPRFFRSIPFSGAVGAAVLGFSALGGFLLLNTLYLQDVRGYSPLHAGLLTLPMAGVTVLGAPVSGRVTGRVGPRLPLLVGGLGITASGLLLTRLEASSSLWLVLLAYVAFGVGFASLNAPITTAAVSGMPRAQAGVAAAVASTSRQVGTTLGVAVFGAIVFAKVGADFAATFAPATHAAWAVMTGSGVLLVVLALVTTTAAARASSHRVAELAGP